MKNKISIKILALLLLFVFQTLPLVYAQQTANQSDINAQIRQEAAKSSQILRIVHFLSDVYGPRLTGSPNHKAAAADWAVKEMKEWGFDNVHLEAWDFGHPGWVNERASGFITAPVQDSLVFEVLAWTPGTNGTVIGQVFQLIPPEKPTQKELTDYFNLNKSNVTGKMILVGKPAVIPVNFDSPPKRRTDEKWRKRLNPQSTTQANPASRPTVSPRPDVLSDKQINEQVNRFLLENKAAVRINDAARPHGIIRVYNNHNFDVTKTIPTVILRNEDFGRIARILADGAPVSLEFNIRNKTFPEGKTSYNVIGEIQGTDRKDEVIMLGAHLDSWNAATGATDNAIGCAAMLEALRILKAIGAKPHRTIRLALWSGEEEGILGSQAYVKKHFGSYENPKPEYAKFGGYFNLDTGTGRSRAMLIFGPLEAATVLSEAVISFPDSGVIGAFSESSRELVNSDYTAFNQAGLPGIGIAQDSIEFSTHTWHSNLDTYERILPEDAKDSAMVIAATVYRLATRGELLPRFTKETMPPPTVPLTSR